MIYLPQKDKTYLGVIWGGPVFLTILALFMMNVAVAIVAALFWALSYWIWNSTIYKVEKNTLDIKCWVFRQKINIMNIISVKKVTNIRSSYSLAVKRFEIKSRKGQIVYISPKEEDKFKKELLGINNKIRIM